MIFDRREMVSFWDVFVCVPASAGTSSLRFALRASSCGRAVALAALRAEPTPIEQEALISVALATASARARAAGAQARRA